MKVLYISTMFPTNSDTIYTDLAEALRDAGHDVTVVATCDWSANTNEGIGVERGIALLRVKTMPIYNVNFLKKGISFISLKYYFNHAIKKYLKDNNYSFILFEAPPVTIAGTIMYAKGLFKCPAYLMLKDIFPQNAVDIKIIKKSSLPYIYFKSQEKKLYKVADIIGCMSNSNRDYIIKHNQRLNPNKVEIFPNTKKIEPFNKNTKKNERIKYGIPDNACVFLFGGNMGKPQYVELLCETVKRCKNDESIFFLFIGRGANRYILKNAIEQSRTKNAILIDNLPRDEYEEITKECNVGLVILNPRFTIPNFPSRILSYMQYGMPVLAATDKVTDIKEMIKKANCGIWTYSGDIDDFINKIKYLVSNKSLRNNMGLSGRKYLENNFNVELSVKILENHFNK